LRRRRLFRTGAGSRTSRPFIVSDADDFDIVQVCTIMIVRQSSFSISTRGRGTMEITDRIRRAVSEAGISVGLATVFVHHTSASLIICENADPSVRTDLERYFGRLVADGDPIFRHTLEGPDDMPAHVRSILTQTSLGIPVADGVPDLGTWQGIFLWEHRDRPHARRISVTCVGS
jgi:secondary thiamine-phosphate synthase enzyme